MKKEKIEELTDKLEKATDDVLRGHIELGRAKQFFNGVGKILSCIKVQQVQLALRLAYKNQSETLPNIPYLGEQKCLPK